jgi:F0F1-type ATP synthase membrane subunit b/b'
MIKNILNEQFKDLVSEETLNVIEEAFQQAVDSKVNEKLQTEQDKIEQTLHESYVAKYEEYVNKTKEKFELEKENVKQKLDEQYTTKLEQLVEKIDNDHTSKLKKLVETIDADHAFKLQKLVKKIDNKHTAMLERVVEKYETQLNEEAVDFQNRIVEEVSNYLDLYLDRNIPAEQVNEAVANIKAARQIAQIRQIVGIDEDFIDTEIKEALIDGKKIIDSLRNELNETIKENAELNQKALSAEAKLLIENKTTDMTATKKQFISKLLKNKTPQYIEENFSYVVDMFEREAAEEVDEIKESVKKQFTRTPQVDRQIIEESVEHINNEIDRSESSDSVMSYLSEMKKFRRNS